MEEKRRLVRSREHRIFGGVCGGLADWSGNSPALVRFLYVLVSVLSAAFPGIVVYLVLWILMPAADGDVSADGRGVRNIAIIVGIVAILCLALLAFLVLGFLFLVPVGSPEISEIVVTQVSRIR